MLLTLRTSRRGVMMMKNFTKTLAFVAYLLHTACTVLPPTLPSWEPTYAMGMSTLSMQCNGSGWSDPTRGAEFGIISYDWSNSKEQWAKAQPMDCEERFLQQASMTKAANPATHTWVYRNVVKVSVVF